MNWKSYFERNTLLGAPKWEEITWVKLIWKIEWLIKWEVGSLLSRCDVLDWYYYSRKHWWVVKKYESWKNRYHHRNEIIDEYISENIFNMIIDKDKVIKRQLREFSKEIIEKWHVKNKNLLKSYIDIWYIDIEDIKILLFKYLIKKWKEILSKAKEPLYISNIWEKKYIIRNYHDLDHDLVNTDKEILAHIIVDWWFTGSEIEKIKDLLKKWWDNLDYFLSNNYKIWFIEEYLTKYII